MQDRKTQHSSDVVYHRQYVVHRLRAMGYPELAEEALHELPDQVDADQLEDWGMHHGVTKDDLISRMGGGP